jgi:hypothetical protein
MLALRSLARASFPRARRTLRLIGPEVFTTPSAVKQMDFVTLTTLC